TPQYYDLQCDWGAFLTADFLYWYARENNLAYASKVQTISNIVPVNDSGIIVPNAYEHIDTDWAPGVRVGLGWNSCCDGWDFYLHWTYFQNDKSSSISVPDFGFTGSGVGNKFIPQVGEFALLNPWLNASLHGANNSQTFDRISAKWRLRFNSIDLEIGRKYWLSQCFTLRPYAGLRGAWTNTLFHTNSFRNFTDVSTTLSQKFQNKFKNKYWGVGFVGGLQPNWHFCSNFILYSNFDISLIWGKAEMKKLENQVETENAISVAAYSNSVNNDFFKMQAILDLALGLRWEETWCCDRYRTALDLGWEHHIWLNHNTRTQTIDYYTQTISTAIINGYRTFVESSTDTMFGGFVLRVRFDF
ncbi:MAG: hypothetical protein K1000chlam3_01791, partial [Chlamydiae bacterium]|nr:hypothetical protein [Chlamydiota bacterium]